MKIKRLQIILSAIILLLFSCTTIKNLTQLASDVKNFEYKIHNIENFSLTGINLSKKKSISSFSVNDGIKLYQAFNSKRLPTDFILNLAVKNPKSSTANNQNTSSSITGLDWRLYIDNKLTVSGDINKEFIIPGSGKTTIIPLSISLDFFEFFANKGYDDILNLALALGGISGSSSRIKLDIKPTFLTSLGSITYPGRITVVDKKFSNK